jgi:hypothetical protein
MDVKPDNYNGKHSVFMVKNFNGAYWQTTIALTKKRFSSDCSRSIIFVSQISQIIFNTHFSN